MFRKIWTGFILLGSALGVAATTAGPASAGLQTNHSEPLFRR